MSGRHKIFISYRRSDAGGHAGRLFDRLQHWFDADTLFYDCQTIGIGDVFPKRIQSALDRAAVVLVLIGPDWLPEINARITQPGIDFVRHEVNQALVARTRGVNVIPVLMNDAAMPSQHQLDTALHDQIAALCHIHAHEFVGVQADWDNQFIRLRERIAATPGMPAPRYLPPAGEERPWRVIEHTVSPHFQDPNGLLPQLHTQLETSGSNALVAPAALFGMGGVGKTQLALKYCLDYRDRYAGVWCLRAETETTLQLDAFDCCTAVGAPVNPNELPTAALKRWLARQSTPWLLVFDNAEDIESLRPHLPQGGPHRIIITSRSPAWNGVAQALALTAWTPEQGADFLAARLPGQNRAELLALATELGGLPLALEQAAAYIETTATAIPVYRKLLAAVDTEGLILDEGRAATGYERSVLATLSLAFAKLTPAAAQLLRLLAYAAPEALPERFLREGAKELPTELAAALGSTLALNRLVGELRNYALAERSEMLALDREPGEVTTRTESALNLHRLTQQALRARLAKAEEDCRRFQAVLRAVCPGETNLPQHWPRFAALMPHITGLDRYLDARWLDQSAFIWLLDRVASYLKNGPAFYAESAHWSSRVWEVSDREFGAEHLNTVSAMSNLASIFFVQGDFSGARKLQEIVVTKFRDVLGAGQPSTQAAMINLAGTLKSFGELDRARELEESVLAIRRQVLGDEHPQTLAVMNNLASTLHEQGDLVGACEIETSLLAVRIRVLGEMHPHTLTSMHNLARTLYTRGSFVSARELQETALTLLGHVFGEDHPYTLSTMSSLALTLQAQGDLDGAANILRSVQITQRRVLGEEHPQTLTTMSNLAVILLDKGDQAVALELQKSVLAIRRQVLGEEHPSTLTSMNNLANTLQAQGDLAGALDLHKTELAICRRVLGEEHPHTLTSMNNLASALHAHGDLAGALNLEKSTLAIRRRVLGEEHPDTLVAMSNLAGTLKVQGDLAGAFDLQKSVLAIRRCVIGEQHPDTIISAWNLFLTQEQLGEHFTAKATLDTLLLPLLSRDPATLSASSNQIRQQLQSMFAALPETP